jgi:uncharacterized membrane protein YhaH (DUF805 family)
MDWRNLLFSFDGRINRAKYWLALLIWLVACGVIIGIAIASEWMIIALIASVVVSVASLVSYIAVGIKRLHDRDKSGWWLLIFYLLPAVFDGIGRGGVPALSLVAFAISIWGFVELGCLRGTDGPNTYGPDPLEAGAEQPA